MCGIVAALAQGGTIPIDWLNRAVAALWRRGPAGQRIWVDPLGRVALGHARLSIIDLATGDQPIANEDERAVIVANGEFYDYERVQDELERSGRHKLRTRSDSEIALHLYEDLGAQCVHRLRGESRDQPRSGFVRSQPAFCLQRSVSRAAVFS
jgi:asparagine synthase (glutamine-hydrolysing)